MNFKNFKIHKIRILDLCLELLSNGNSYLRAELTDEIRPVWGCSVKKKTCIMFSVFTVTKTSRFTAKFPPRCRPLCRIVLGENPSTSFVVYDRTLKKQSLSKSPLLSS